MALNEMFNISCKTDSCEKRTTKELLKHQIKQIALIDALQHSTAKFFSATRKYHTLRGIGQCY